MKLARYALAVVAALALMGQDGCETETTDKPDKTADKPDKSDKGGGGGSTAPPKPKPEEKATVGDSITIRGTEDSLKVKVTVLDVIDPVQAGEYDQPAAGKRYVGLDLMLKNVGQDTYDDSPSNGATLVLSNSQQADAALLVDGTCALASSVTLSPGAKRRLCIPYEIPAQAKPAQFQFGLDSGFGPQTGEWKLR